MTQCTGVQEGSPGGLTDRSSRQTSTKFLLNGVSKRSTSDRFSGLKWNILPTTDGERFRENRDASTCECNEILTWQFAVNCYQLEARAMNYVEAMTVMSYHFIVSSD